MSGKMLERINSKVREFCQYHDDVDCTGLLLKHKTTLLESIRGETSINKLAAFVRLDWDKVYFGAVPYLNAMRYLETKEDMYGLDSATSIVLYFLSNATTWKGEVAREVKKRLKEIVKYK